MASPKIAAVRGMNDLLPAQAPLWEAFETAAVRMLRGYGYAQIRTPILESTALFRRGIALIQWLRVNDVQAEMAAEKSGG